MSNRSQDAIRSNPQPGNVLRDGREMRYTVAEVCNGWVYYDLTILGDPSGGDRMTLAQWATLGLSAHDLAAARAAALCAA